MSTLNDTTDAMVWAEEFCRIFDGRTISAEEGVGIDLGTMLAWFANAIETGRNAGRKETCPHTRFIDVSDDLSLCAICGWSRSVPEIS